MDKTMTKAQFKRLCVAVRAAVLANAEEWDDAPAAAARAVCHELGLYWDFTGWAHAHRLLSTTERKGLALGGWRVRH